VDAARSAAHVSGLAALTRAGFWPALKPDRSRIAACLMSPRNASTHGVDLRGTKNAVRQRRDNRRRSTPCVDAARSAAHVSGLAALMHIGLWPALKPYRSRIAACLLSPRNASTHGVDLRGTANAFPSAYRETWARFGGDITIGTTAGDVTIGVDPRHAWIPRAARRMCPDWRH